MVHMNQRSNVGGLHRLPLKMMSSDRELPPLLFSELDLRSVLEKQERAMRQAVEALPGSMLRSRDEAHIKTELTTSLQHRADPAYGRRDQCDGRGGAPRRER